MWPDAPVLDTLLAESRHPRILTLDFLSHCTARIARFYHYWDRARDTPDGGQRTMPRRQDIDPIEIPDLLPYLVLTEVLPEAPWLRYRLVGTRQVAIRGHDPTGLPVLGHHIGHHDPRHADGIEVLLNYRLVIERRAPVFDPVPIRGPKPNTTGSFAHAQTVEQGTLLLPLSSDGSTVDLVFCCTDIADLDIQPTERVEPHDGQR